MIPWQERRDRRRSPEVFPQSAYPREFEWMVEKGAIVGYREWRYVDCTCRDRHSVRHCFRYKFDREVMGCRETIDHSFPSTSWRRCWFCGRGGTTRRIKGVIPIDLRGTIWDVVHHGMTRREHDQTQLLFLTVADHDLPTCLSCERRLDLLKHEIRESNSIIRKIENAKST